MKITVVAKVQETCEHPEIREAPAACGLEPLRICLHCGMTEIGYGFKVMVKPDANGIRWEPAHISRNDVYVLRQGATIGTDDQTKLLRKETTVKEIVQGWRKDGLGL
jgi:hypothetical protein